MLKERLLKKELRRSLVLADLGDKEAKEKAERIGLMITKKEFPDKAKPIIVIYPSGESEVLATKNEAKEKFKIGSGTLNKYIETGEPDKFGRCYDYMIL